MTTLLEQMADEFCRWPLPEEIWIDAKIQFPKQGQQVLCYCEYTPRGAWFYDIAVFKEIVSKSGFSTISPWQIRGGTIATVTHWRALPEAPPLVSTICVESESIVHRQKAWAILNAVIEIYSDDYEYGDDGYSPSEIELAICHDFLQGLIAREDFISAITKVCPVRAKTHAEALAMFEQIAGPKIAALEAENASLIASNATAMRNFIVLKVKYERLREFARAVIDRAVGNSTRFEVYGELRAALEGLK